MKLPTLYKKTSKGADQEWSIETEGRDIITRWGQVGGALQETRETIASGKNIGRSNETTAEEQAEAEALSRWEKKLKKGYVKDLDAARAGETDASIEGGIFPMLAHKYAEQGHKIFYPAYAQPKLDGHRCIATIIDGEATLWSRTRKPITGLPHIIKDLEAWAQKNSLEEIVLDGELYEHSHRDNFEQLSSYIRTPEAQPGSEIVQYHIYDVAREKIPFSERFVQLQGLPFNSLIQVQTISVEEDDDLLLAFEQFLEEGYEGLMVRNAASLYVNKRSYDLQKLKEMDDAEFKVIGVKEGRGKMAGRGIFICVMADGKDFTAKMKGKTSHLKVYYDHPELAIGRQLTVKYQGFTKKGLPRFGVALRFKEE